MDSQATMPDVVMALDRVGPALKHVDLSSLPCLLEERCCTQLAEHFSAKSVGKSPAVWKGDIIHSDVPVPSGTSARAGSACGRADGGGFAAAGEEGKAIAKMPLHGSVPKQRTFISKRVYTGTYKFPHIQALFGNKSGESQADTGSSLVGLEFSSKFSLQTLIISNMEHAYRNFEVCLLD